MMMQGVQEEKCVEGEGKGRVMQPRVPAEVAMLVLAQHLQAREMSAMLVACREWNALETRETWDRLVRCPQLWLPIVNGRRHEDARLVDTKATALNFEYNLRRLHPVLDLEEELSERQLEAAPMAQAKLIITGSRGSGVSSLVDSFRYRESRLYGVGALGAGGVDPVEEERAALQDMRIRLFQATTSCASRANVKAKVVDKRVSARPSGLSHSLYERDGTAIVLCVDVTQQASYDYALESIRNQVLPAGVPVVLAATKVDDTHHRVVSPAAMQDLSDAAGLPLFQTSAQQGKVDRALLCALMLAAQSAAEDNALHGLFPHGAFEAAPTAAPPLVEATA